MSDLRLPYVLQSDESFSHFLLLLDENLGAISTPQMLNPGTVPDAALYELAKFLGVLGYKGWLLSESQQKQRELLASAVSLNKAAGTIWSLEQALASVGFPNVRIQEGIPLPGGGVDRWAIAVELDSSSAVDANAGIVPGTIKELAGKTLEAWCPVYVKRPISIVTRIVVTLNGSRRLDGSTRLDGLPS